MEAIQHLPTPKDIARIARMAAEGPRSSALELAQASMSIICHLSNLFKQFAEDQKRWGLLIKKANSEKAKALEAWKEVEVRGEALGEQIVQLSRKEKAIKEKEGVVARVRAEAEDHMFVNMKSCCKAIKDIIERVPHFDRKGYYMGLHPGAETEGRGERRDIVG